MHPLEVNKIELFRDGWTVLKNIFSTSEVKNIRKKLKQKIVLIVYNQIFYQTQL